MHSSDNNDGSGLSKLAFLASAAATAAFVVGQTRLARRLREAASTNSNGHGHHHEPQMSNGSAVIQPPHEVELLTAPADIVNETIEESSAISQETTDDRANETGFSVPDAPSLTPNSSANGNGNGHDTRLRFLPQRSARERLHYGLPVRRPNPPRHQERSPETNSHGEPGLDIEPPVETNSDLWAPPVEVEAASSYFESESAREVQRHGGPWSSTAYPDWIPAGHSNGHHLTAEEGAISVVMAPEVEEEPAEDEEFDADYLAVVEAITSGFALEDEDIEAEETVDMAAAAALAVETPLITPGGTRAVATPWWLPAPKVRYIIWTVGIIALTAALGTDPALLVLDGLRASVTINSTSDLLFVGWLLCAALVFLPLGSVIGAASSRLKRQQPAGLAESSLRPPPQPLRPELVEHESTLTWTARIVATAALIVGAVLYTPDALGIALDTDYPLATVTSSAMAPDLKDGEVLLLEGVDSIDQLSAGDIIAYEHRAGVAVRRVVEVNEGSVITKADVSPNPDPPVPFENVVGRIVEIAGTKIKLPNIAGLASIGEETTEPAVEGSLTSN